MTKTISFEDFTAGPPHHKTTTFQGTVTVLDLRLRSLSQTTEPTEVSEQLTNSVNISGHAAFCMQYTHQIIGVNAPNTTYEQHVVI